ncbi:MAG: DNA methyltransferase, partial [Pseudomonadota bacterium]
PIDIRATRHLNQLYVELLKENEDWASADRRHDMNEFMARLIFCFFAEDTGIFVGSGLFTDTVEQMSDARSGNTHEVIAELFRAMDTRPEDRKAGKFRPWADAFPYVNGGLFAGLKEVPCFSRIARSYLLHAGRLDWQAINPDIFGSMIQAVADDEERGALGMHYTSVPNILKVLNPLFLDDLRGQLDAAGNNPRKLLNLRRRISRIRVFDPACGSGNFLVIAYKEMRTIEADINRRRGEEHLGSTIPLTNFRGIEIRDFPAQIARLALIIAEYQCDVLYRGQKDALAEFLPLDAMNWITCGNALRISWQSVCPPTGKRVKYIADDLFSAPLDQAQIDFESEEGETYLCGNPQFKGARKQSKSQKSDLSLVFDGHKDFKDCDYVAGWYLKASEFLNSCAAKFAFVSTSSICEGEQVAHLWSRLYDRNCHIIFAHQRFKWQNNASNNAVVGCVIIGVEKIKPSSCEIYTSDSRRTVQSISPYLVAGPEIYVTSCKKPLNQSLSLMVSGSMPRDGGHLILSADEKEKLLSSTTNIRHLIRKFVGSQELAHYRNRFCLWIEDGDLNDARNISDVAQRIDKVLEFRNDSPAKTTKGYASIPHKFAQRSHKAGFCISVAKTTSENREYLPVDLLSDDCIVSDAAFAIYNPPIWMLSAIASRLHLVWIATVCGRLEARYRYSSTLGWNTFPVPTLTEKNKADLTQCAENILLAREAHFPATIAELYDPETMPDDLRRAHDRNDEVLERIYIGRRFRNDTERLEKLFELYTKKTSEKQTDPTSGDAREIRAG